MHPAFRDGLVASLPFQLALALFGTITGAAMAEAGLDLTQAMAMSVLVLAGASQLAATQLLADGAPVAVVLATGIAINLRFAMYAATLSPYLDGLPGRWRWLAAYCIHDQSFAVSMQRFERREEDWRARYAFFLAAGGVTALMWHAFTALGHVAGAALSGAVDISFVLPAIFLGMIAPFLTTRPRWLAAAVASATSLALRGMPLETGLLAAACLGILAGLWAEGRRA